MLMASNAFMSHFAEGSSSSGKSDCEVVKLATTENKWEVELDVAKFKPEDLKVDKSMTCRSKLNCYC